MPFKTKMRPYTRESISKLKFNQNGVYGIFRNDMPVYIGNGDLKERLLAHLNGDNACIVSHVPNLWVGELYWGDATARKAKLIREYHPTCNRVVPS